MIYLSYAWDMPNMICAWDMYQISIRYPRDLAEICLKFALICLRNVWNKLSWECHTRNVSWVGQNKIVVLDKCHCDSLHLFQIVLYVYIQCRVNIWLVYVEIQVFPNLGGGVGGCLTGNIATPWLHLASWSLPDSQLSWESKMEPSVATFPY